MTIDGSTPAQPRGDLRTPEQIEADLAVTRERLTHNLQDLSEAISPAGLRARASGRARRVFLDEFGGVRPERIAAAAAVVAGVVWLSRLTRTR